MGLIEDAAKAREAGLTYGQWKAQQPFVQPVIVKKRVILDGSKKCEICGSRLKGSQRRFCSWDCYLKSVKRKSWGVFV